MKASWKFFTFAGGLALAAGAGVACTVTTSGGDGDAGDLFGDAGTGSDTSTLSDTSTPFDSGITTGCTSLTETFSDGGAQALTFDQDGGSACDTCLEQNCCSDFKGCFDDSTGDCQDLNGCLNDCVTSGGTADGGDCECSTLHTSGSATLFSNFTSCVSSHCSSACPQ